MDLLCLRGSRGFSGSDRPHGFIGDDDGGHFSPRESGEDPLTCAVMILSVIPCSRSASVSPTHRIGFSIEAIAFFAFVLINSSFSPKYWRLSECPSITYSHPADRIMFHEISR